ncbi:hypothetical protein F4604DRAFT_1920222 [Suillus subluteus]|nr:hypothetical protein F4604DRAFT_1920222 [Suillus subluteus]
MAISENDIPRIHQVINITLRNGASIREIINKLEDALEGVYCPQGYGADDLDILGYPVSFAFRSPSYLVAYDYGLPISQSLDSNQQPAQSGRKREGLKSIMGGHSG